MDSLPIGSQDRLGFLGKRLGGALLFLVGSGLVLGFVVPGELGSLFRMAAPICKLPELAGGLNLMVTEFLAHLNSTDVGVKRSNH